MCCCSWMRRDAPPLRRWSRYIAREIMRKRLMLVAQWTFEPLRCVFKWFADILGEYFKCMLKYFFINTQVFEIQWKHSYFIFWKYYFSRYELSFVFDNFLYTYNFFNFNFFKYFIIQKNLKNVFEILGSNNNNK